MKYKDYEIEFTTGSLSSSYSTKKELDKDVARHIARDMLINTPPRGFYKGWGALKVFWSDNLDKNYKWNILYKVKLYGVLGGAMEKLGLTDLYYSDHFSMNSEFPLSSYVKDYCVDTPETKGKEFLTNEQFYNIEKECEKIIIKLLRKEKFICQNN